MQSFMDKIKVTSKIGRGTIVTLEKNIIRRPLQNQAAKQAEQDG